MSAIVQIGKAGVTEAVIKQVEQALADHELIKVKVGAECPADRFEVADRLGGEPGINIVQMVGRVLLLYKRHPHSPRYEGKRAKAATKTAKPGAAASPRGGAPSRSGKERGRRRARGARR
jgi:RNA-binding protein